MDWEVSPIIIKYTVIHLFALVSLQVEKAIRIEEQLHSQLVRIIQKRSSGSNETFILRKGVFLCHSNPTKTTYRTTLFNLFPTTNSTHLVGIIQNWVSGAPSLVFDGLLVRVAPACPASVARLDEEECDSGVMTDPGLGKRITQTLNECAVKNLGDEICSLNAGSANNY